MVLLYINSILHVLADATKPCKHVKEEKLVKLRQANYKLLSRIFSQAAFCAVLSFTYSALSSPGLETIGSASVVVASYVQHLLVAKEVVCLTPGRIKFLTYLHHIMAFLLHILQVASESDTFGAKAAPNTATRFVLVFAFLDPWVSIPFQFLFTAADALTYFTVCSGSHMAPYVCFGLCFVFVSSVTWLNEWSVCVGFLEKPTPLFLLKLNNNFWASWSRW